MIAVAKHVHQRFKEIKKKWTGGGSSSSPFQLDSLIVKFPAEDLRLKEEDVQVVTTNRVMKAKIVLTNEMLAFASLEGMTGKAILASDLPNRPCWDWIALPEIEEISQSREKGSKVSLDIKRGDFIIHTYPDGRSCGKPYWIRFPSEKACRDWMTSIVQEADQAKMELTVSRIAHIQERCAIFYNSKGIQNFVAFLIFCSFALNITENQIRPEEGTDAFRTLANLNLVFTMVFTLEVIFNLFGSWWRPFFASPWNLLDLLVVVASLVVFASSLPPYINRIILAFRVLRLFGRFRQLRQIVLAIAGSLVPVLNAFLVGLVVAAIYVIIGVDLFHERAVSDFGTFGRGAYTMFMVAAADSWKVEDLPPFKGEQAVDVGVCLFVMTFIIVVNWTLLQVQMAVLLDHFIAEYEESKEEYAGKMANRHGKRGRRCAIDPILHSLCSGFDTDEQLRDDVGAIFQVLDVERESELGYEQLRQGLMKLDCEPVINLSHHEFLSITRNLSLCNQAGRLGKLEFLMVIREQLHSYAQRQIIDALALADEQSKEKHFRFVCTSMKVVLSAVEELAPPSAPQGKKLQRTATAGTQQSMMDVMGAPARAARFEHSLATAREEMTRALDELLRLQGHEPRERARDRRQKQRESRSALHRSSSVRGGEARGKGSMRRSHSAGSKMGKGHVNVMLESMGQSMLRREAGDAEGSKRAVQSSEHPVWNGSRGSGSVKELWKLARETTQAPAWREPSAPALARMDSTGSKGSAGGKRYSGGNSAGSRGSRGAGVMWEEHGRRDARRAGRADEGSEGVQDRSSRRGKEGEPSVHTLGGNVVLISRRRSSSGSQESSGEGKVNITV